MKRKIGLLVLALVCGAGLWYWAHQGVAVSSQVKGTRTEPTASQPAELGLIWVTADASGAQVATAAADHQTIRLTPTSENVSVACRISDSELAFFSQSDGISRLWLWTAGASKSRFIIATRQQPDELLCDQLGNHIMYTAIDGSRRVLYEVDLASGTTHLIDAVTGRAAFDQTGLRIVYPMAEGLFYREISRSGELSDALQVATGRIAAAAFTQSNNAVVYVVKGADGYDLVQTGWQDQISKPLYHFAIGQDNDDWSLEYSSDGDRLLYRFGPKGFVGQSTVGIIQSDGTGAQILQTGVGRTTWLPHEPLIVYEKLRIDSGNVFVDLWRMSAQGSDREVIAGSGRNYVPGFRIVDPTPDIQD